MVRMVVRNYENFLAFSERHYQCAQSLSCQSKPASPYALKLRSLVVDHFSTAFKTRDKKQKSITIEPVGWQARSKSLRGYSYTDLVHHNPFKASEARHQAISRTVQINKHNFESNNSKPRQRERLGWTSKPNNVILQRHTGINEPLSSANSNRCDRNFSYEKNKSAKNVFF